MPGVNHGTNGWIGLQSHHESHSCSSFASARILCHSRKGQHGAREKEAYGIFVITEKFKVTKPQLIVCRFRETQRQHHSLASFKTSANFEQLYMKHEDVKVVHLDRVALKSVWFHSVLPLWKIDSRAKKEGGIWWSWRPNHSLCALSICRYQLLGLLFRFTPSFKTVTA